VDFPIKPGETQFEISYMVPYTSPGRFGSKDLAGSPETMLVAPSGVELKGDGIEFGRQEPRTQASIYIAKKPNFEVEITGEMKASEQQGEEGGSQGPSLEQVMPKLFSQIDGSAGFFQKVLAVKWILLLAFAILTLGFILLYRQQPSAEAASVQRHGAARAGEAVVLPNQTAVPSQTSLPSRDRKGADPREKHERRRR
jgi:hypothetical protein